AWGGGGRGAGGSAPAPGACPGGVPGTGVPRVGGGRLRDSPCEPAQECGPCLSRVLDVPQRTILCVPDQDTLSFSHLHAASLGGTVAALVPLGVMLHRHRILP